MATLPYWLKMQVALAASGTGTLQATVPNNEKWTLNQMFVESTGAFSITGFRITGGNNLTNAGANNTIPSTMLQQDANTVMMLYEFKTPIMLSGGSSIYIDLLDTSAAPNTVQTVLNGSRDI